MARGRHAPRLRMKTSSPTTSPMTVTITSTMSAKEGPRRRPLASYSPCAAPPVCGSMPAHS
eukprot:scaffold12867_cov30-Phaeocystis_antarctica.AAC.1